jgi:hypothetical protein
VKGFPTIEALMVLVGMGLLTPGRMVKKQQEKQNAELIAKEN